MDPQIAAALIGALVGSLVTIISGYLLMRLESRRSQRRDARARETDALIRASEAFERCATTLSRAHETSLRGDHLPEAKKLQTEFSRRLNSVAMLSVDSVVDEFRDADYALAETIDFLEHLDRGAISAIADDVEHSAAGLMVMTWIIEDTVRARIQEPLFSASAGISGTTSERVGTAFSRRIRRAPRTPSAASSSSVSKG